MAQNQPLITVILPIFNAMPYLPQCLDSIVGQDYENLEIICLNDGSTDTSLEVMTSYANQDSRITVINKENEGYGATCNRGLELAQGTWIAIVEPDDWIEQSMYSSMMAFAQPFEETTPLDIIKTPYWRIWMPDTAQQRKLNCSYRGRITPPEQPFTIDEAAHLLTHHPSIWSALYRRSFLDEYGIRFKPIPGAGWADNPFLVETLLQAQAIGYLDRPFYCYREETPEKSKSFALRSPLLPFERWNDMLDVIERLGVEDPVILRAHYSRGFTYLSGVIEEVDLTHEEVRDAARAMFSRMNPELALTDNEVSPGMKQLFCRLQGMPDPKVSHLPYWANLVNAGLYNLKNTGPAPTLYAVRSYLSKHKRREGR